MLKTGTEITRKEALPDDHPQAYLNNLRVVGPSPVKDATVEDWVGGGGNAVIVTPAEGFGANQVLPEEIAARDYNVSKLPEETAIPEPPPTPVNELPTPEQAFAAAARESK